MTATSNERRPPETVPDWPTDELERVGSCPACGASRRHRIHDDLVDGLFGVDGHWQLWQCDDCSSGYLDPRPTVQSISKAYSTYYTHVQAPIGGTGGMGIRQQVKNAYLNRYWGYEITPRLRLTAPLTRRAPLLRRHADRWIRHLPRPSGTGRLLDVGCGDGEFLEYMSELGWKAQGIDPDPSAIAAAKARGCEAEVRQLRELLPITEDQRFDAITLCHVIEHFHHPGQELEICRQLLRPGGVLWIATPNLAGIGHRLYGGSWRGLEPPRHLCIYTPGSLLRQLAAAGFVKPKPLATQPVAKRMFLESAQLESRIHGRQGVRDGAAAITALSTVTNLLAGPLPKVGDELVAVARNP